MKGQPSTCFFSYNKQSNGYKIPYSQPIQKTKNDMCFSKQAANTKERYQSKIYANSKQEWEPLSSSMPSMNSSQYKNPTLGVKASFDIK